MATSSRVISGTPRMNSMKPTQSVLTMSMSERRPSASRMPSGSEKAMPVMPMVDRQHEAAEELGRDRRAAPGSAAPGQQRPTTGPTSVEPPDERGERPRRSMASRREPSAATSTVDQRSRRRSRRRSRSAPRSSRPRAASSRGRGRSTVNQSELARQLGDEDRRQRHEHQDEGQRRPPVLVVRIEAEEELLPAFADHREAGAARALAPGVRDDLRGTRSASSRSRPNARTRAGCGRPARRGQATQNGEDRVQPASRTGSRAAQRDRRRPGDAGGACGGQHLACGRRSMSAISALLQRDARVVPVQRPTRSAG